MPSDRKPSQSWLAKLAMTSLIGAALSLGTFWQFSSFFNVGGLLDTAMGMRHVITTVCWTALVAIVLSLSEQGRWQRSAVEALVLALVASAVITATFLVLIIVGESVVQGFLH